MLLDRCEPADRHYAVVPRDRDQVGLAVRRPGVERAAQPGSATASLRRRPSASYGARSAAARPSELWSTTSTSKLGYEQREHALDGADDVVRTVHGRNHDRDPRPVIRADGLISLDQAARRCWDSRNGAPEAGPDVHARHHTASSGRIHDLGATTIETAFELAALAACAVPAVRVIATPAARRELRAKTPLAFAVAAVGVAYVAVAVVGALESQWLLRALTAVTVAVTAALAWRAQPHYGARRGLPPGSLGLRRSLLAIPDRGLLRRESERRGPVFKVAQFHHGVVCVVGLEACRDVLRRHGDALRPAPLPLSGEIPRGFLRYMDARDYESYSPLFRSAFSAAVRTVGPEARARISATLSALAAEGGADPHPALAGSPHDCRSGCCSDRCWTGTRYASTAGATMPRSRPRSAVRPRRRASP